MKVLIGSASDSYREHYQLEHLLSDFYYN